MGVQAESHTGRGTVPAQSPEARAAPCVSRPTSAGGPVTAVNRPRGAKGVVGCQPGAHHRLRPLRRHRAVAGRPRRRPDRRPGEGHRRRGGPRLQRVPPRRDPEAQRDRAHGRGHPHRRPEPVGPGRHDHRHGSRASTAPSARSSRTPTEINQTVVGINNTTRALLPVVQNIHGDDTISAQPGGVGGHQPAGPGVRSGHRRHPDRPEPGQHPRAPWSRSTGTRSPSATVLPLNVLSRGRPAARPPWRPLVP